MGNKFSKDDPNRYLPVPREQYLRLGLAMPPENGFDDFRKLKWCRDMKDEQRQAKKAEKEGKKDFQIERKYVLCLTGEFEPYRKNDPPINLNKKGHKPLPAWRDDDFKDEILRNGYYFQNDAFILEHYKQAIKPAEDYPYVEQFIPAYQHWNNGQKPSKEQQREHKLRVATIIMEDIQKLESEDGTDVETLQKMKDILISMDLEDEETKECEENLAANKSSDEKKK